MLLVQFFDFLFLNPICLLVGEAIEHDFFSDDCAVWRDRGGNITGFTGFEYGSSVKWLELGLTRGP